MNATLKTVQLIKEQFASTLLIDGGFLAKYPAADVHFREMLMNSFDGMQIQMTAYIAAQQVAKREVRYPKTWIDAVKVRFFPAWLIKRFPAKMEYVCLDAKILYPEFKIPNHRGEMVIYQNIRPYDFPEREEE